MAFGPERDEETAVDEFGEGHAKNQAEMSKTDAYLLRNDFRGDLVALGNEDWASIHMNFFYSKVIIIYDEREIFWPSTLLKE